MPASGHTRAPFEPSRKAAYIEALARLGDHAFARLDVGITEKTIKRHRKNDPEFDQACEDAMHTYRKGFIDSLVQRGKDGVQRPVFHNGEIVGHVTEYSDKLLLEHLKVIDARYRNKIEVELSAHITTTDLQLDKLQPESRVLLEKILAIEAAATELLDAPDE